MLVVLVGPQASGKSALARGLSADLRRDGQTVALVELDDIAAMALPTLTSWQDAHRIFSMVAGQWARTSLDTVVAEGSGSRAEVDEIAAHAPAGRRMLTVAVTTTFTVALARAKADPTRGASKDEGFLRRVYDRWPADLRSLRADVVVDTTHESVALSVARIRTALASGARTTDSRRAGRHTRAENPPSACSS